MEWSWRRRQEVTGVATEEAAGRRGGDTQRRQGNSESAELRGGNMSGLPSESLRSGGLVCTYYPHCRAQHGVWQCVRLAYMATEHRTAIEIARGEHPIFFSWFAIDGSITLFLLFNFDKSRFLGICRFANSINRCFRQVTKNRSLSRFANR